MYYRYLFLPTTNRKKGKKKSSSNLAKDGLGIKIHEIECNNLFHTLNTAFSHRSYTKLVLTQSSYHVNSINDIQSLLKDSFRMIY